MITLNAKEVYARAREAYANGELQAQQPEDTRVSYCSYAGPCAIGVSIPVDQREDYDYSQINLDENDRSFPGMGIGSLEGEGRVFTDNSEALFQLQKAHDEWVNWREGSLTEEEAETIFVAQLEKF